MKVLRHFAREFVIALSTTSKLDNQLSPYILEYVYLRMVGVDLLHGLSLHLIEWNGFAKYGQRALFYLGSEPQQATFVRARLSQSGTKLRFPCPYCNRDHVHRLREGPRAAHCDGGPLIRTGYILNREDHPHRSFPAKAPFFYA